MEYILLEYNNVSRINKVKHAIKCNFFKFVLASIKREIIKAKSSILKDRKTRREIKIVGVRKISRVWKRAGESEGVRT